MHMPHVATSFKFIFSLSRGSLARIQACDQVELYFKNSGALAHNVGQMCEVILPRVAPPLGHCMF